MVVWFMIAESMLMRMVHEDDADEDDDAETDEEHEQDDEDHLDEV